MTNQPIPSKHLHQLLPVDQRFHPSIRPSDSTPISIGTPGVDVIRGSTNIPLSPQGEAQAKAMAAYIRHHGGVDQIFSSSLIRTIQTAQYVEDANPGSRIIEITGSLHPWHLGGLEGQPTLKVLAQMNGLVRHHPDHTPPPLPHGSQSTEPPETFNSFLSRVLNFVVSGINRWKADPSQRFLWVGHYRNIKAIQAWCAAGCPPDLSIDVNEMLRHDGTPGDLHQFHPDAQTLINVTGNVQGKLKGGIYVLRHGYTALNGENPGNGNGNGNSYTPGANSKEDEV